MTDVIAKLGEKELKKRLSEWFLYWQSQVESRDQQAYNQLREIIEWSFDPGVAQIVNDLKKTEDWDMTEAFEEPLKQKPAVADNAK